MLKKRTCSMRGKPLPNVLIVRLLRRLPAPGVARMTPRYCSVPCQRAHWARGPQHECPCACICKNFWSNRGRLTGHRLPKSPSSRPRRASSSGPASPAAMFAPSSLPNSSP